MIIEQLPVNLADRCFDTFRCKTVREACTKRAARTVLQARRRRTIAPSNEGRDMSEGSRASIVLPVIQLTPYLRVRIAVDDESLEIEHTPALAGLVPLGLRGLRVPFHDLAAASVVRFLRVDCIAVAATSLGLLAVARPPLTLSIVLGVLAIFEILLTIQPRRAVRIERTDGRTWTIPFCRLYEFDASLAIEDALARSEAAAGSSARSSANSAR